MVGANCLAAVLEELLDVHGDGQALQFAAALLDGGAVVELLMLRCGSQAAHHLVVVHDRRRACDTTRLSVYCLSSLITNRVSRVLALGRHHHLLLPCCVAITACCHGPHIANTCCRMWWSEGLLQ